MCYGTFMCNFLLLFISLEIFTEKRQCWFVRVPYVPLVINDLSADESVVEWNSSGGSPVIPTHLPAGVSYSPVPPNPVSPTA